MITIESGKRKGFVLNLKQRKNRKRNISEISFPEPTAPPKFNPRPHPMLKLDRQALLPETSEEDYQRAVTNFSCSISHKTQSVYATTARHLLAAEQVLGRHFSIPPSDQDQLFFLNYLQGRDIKADTVSNYMSAFKFVSMSRGASNPPKLSSLASQLMSGDANSKKDAMVLASGTYAV